MWFSLSVVQGEQGAVRHTIDARCETQINYLMSDGREQMRHIAFGLLIIISNADFALAGIYCIAPTAPSFYETKPSKPDVPFCVNEFSGTHSCDDITIQNYNSEVESYNSRLRSYQSNVDNYIAELNQYVRDAQTYAHCEASFL